MNLSRINPKAPEQSGLSRLMAPRGQKDDRVRRVCHWIFDQGRLAARLLDRLLRFRCEGDCRLHAGIAPALLAR